METKRSASSPTFAQLRKYATVSKRFEDAERVARGTRIEIDYPQVSSTYSATHSGENLGTIPAGPRIMQLTRTAFQAQASLNPQASDSKSHTLVRITYTLRLLYPSPANFDDTPQPALLCYSL